MILELQPKPYSSMYIFSMSSLDLRNLECMHTHRKIYLVKQPIGLANMLCCRNSQHGQVKF